MIALPNHDVFVPFDLLAHFLGIATHENINAAPVPVTLLHNQRESSVTSLTDHGRILVTP